MSLFDENDDMGKTKQRRSSGNKGGFGKLPVILGSIIAIGVLGLILIFQMVSWNEADERIVHQSAVSGDLTVIDSPGPYLKAFGTTTIYKKVISVNFTGDATAKASAPIPLIPVRFLDTTTGKARGVARFRIPGGKDLLKIHEEFGSQGTLVSNLLVRAVTENVKASARMMSVEQHYSGGNGQLSQDFSDQLTNGIFVTEQIIETPKKKAKVVPGKKAAEVVEEEDTLSQQQRVTVKIKLDAQGAKMRNAPMLAAYGIAVVDASIIDVDYEEKVDERLERQKKAAADEALARQELKKAQQQAKTEVALGEQAIAKQRAESERLKIKEQIDAERTEQNAIIAARQKVKVAEQKALEQAEILKQQRLEATGMDVIAAARRRAKDSAIDPQYVFDQKLKAHIQVQTAMYQYMSKAQLVPLVMNGGTGKGGVPNGMDYLQILGNKAALDMANELKTGK